MVSGLRFQLLPPNAGWGSYHHRPGVEIGKGVRPAGAAVSADARNLSIPRERQSSGPRSPLKRNGTRWVGRKTIRALWLVVSLSPPPHARLDRRRDPTWAVPAWRHDALFESRGDTSFPVVTARHPTSISMSLTLIGECSQRKRIR